jgi:purine catabolism regulator
VSVLLQQLLADPELGLELIAGGSGVTRRGPIRWAHISEIPDPTPWLSGGEVLLTTGLGVKNDPRLQRALVTGLDRRGCTAIGFGVGVWLDEVPSALAAEADARGFPLFTVPYEVPFIAVTKYVARRVFEAHHAGLRRALDLHRRVLAAVTSGGGLQEVLRVTVSSLGNADAVVFDPFGQLLARAGTSAQRIDPSALWRALPAARSRPTSVNAGGRVATFAPIRVGGDVAGTMVLVSDDEPDEAQQLLAEQGVAAASVELSRGMSARRARRTRVSELLHDALEGRASRQRLGHRLEQLGIDPAGGYHVLAVAAETAKVTAVCGLLEDTVVAGAHVAVGMANGVVHALVQPPDAELGNALVDVARARSLPVLRVGRSRVQRDVDGLSAGLRESAAAARRPGSGVLDVTDLGVPGLLAGIGSDVAAEAFITQVLGPVLDHDGDEAGSLIETLRAYLRHGCRPGPAATELRVHRHTLSYRLDRIRQLTDRDPRAGAHLLSYGLALELLDQQSAP